MERKNAKNVYRWLWFSPLLTVPTIAILMLSNFSEFGISVLLTGLWHLVLLVPVLNKKDEFVQWHGRQALSLAIVRTIVPFGILTLLEEDGLLLTIPILLLIWLGGNLWGEEQAKVGDCSLARWFGHADVLPGPEPEEGEDMDIGTLEDIVRFSDDPQKRKEAILKLEELGFIEEL
jgi:hypothetical protein